MPPRLSALLLASTLLAACGAPEDRAAMDAQVAEYLLLELSMAQHDPDHVDAYFGPDTFRQQAVALELTPAEIDARAAGLQTVLEAAARSRDAPAAGRVAVLLARLEALRTRIALAEGAAMGFDAEARRIFGVSAPDYDAAHFEAMLARIDELVPGDGPLSTRVNEFRQQFVIPEDRLAAVFDAAIAECRRRTLRHIELPETESFRVEYVNDKPWSGYNWYQGSATSLIQINTDLPIFISRAVDLGCHEGYPGHHTFNTLREQRLLDARGWLEYSLYPLFSPDSVIAEGSGEYGIRLAFPAGERIAFEREVLFPLAGLDAGQANRYYELLELLEGLDYADNEAARDYLNGHMTREEAVQWLVDYALKSPERARQRLDFIETYRSYVINYNVGQDLVRGHVERGRAGPAERWRRFADLIASPVLPGDLAAREAHGAGGAVADQPRLPRLRRFPANGTGAGRLRGVAAGLPMK